MVLTKDFFLLCCRYNGNSGSILYAPGCVLEWTVCLHARRLVTSAMVHKENGAKQGGGGFCVPLAIMLLKYVCVQLYMFRISYCMVASATWQILALRDVKA